MAGNHSREWHDAKNDLEKAERKAADNPNSGGYSRDLDAARREFERQDRNS